jgi:DNA-binding response OmpR family regulator
MSTPVRILLIEDHAPLRENIAETLELAGYQVTSASDGKTGIQLALEQMPQLVLCDIMLPQTNGYQVFSAIRQNALTAHMAFIFMTGNTDTAREHTTTGNFLSKPFTQEQLLDIVKNKISESASGKKTEQEKLEHIEALEYILSSISHELRNPICSSLGLASLLDHNLSNKNNPEEIKRIVAGIKANAARLENITCALTDVVYQAIQNYKHKVI